MLCSNLNFPGLCAGNVPHQGVGVPDQQGVREVQQVPACSQGAICFTLLQKAVMRFLGRVVHFYTSSHKFSGHVSLAAVLWLNRTNI